MKLPAVAIAAPFAGGILLGLSRSVTSRATLDPFPILVATIICVLLVFGFLLIWRNFAWAAAAASLAAWMGLGILAGALRCNRFLRSTS